MKHDHSRLANLLGALAIGIADRIRHAVAEQTSLGGEAAAALIVLGHEPGLSVDQLGKVLKLSHPGTVRVVDRLVAAGLAERQPAASDRRALALHLTRSGEAERARVLQGRGAAVAAVLDHVPPEHYPVLEQLVEQMLVSLPSDATSALSVCRFCDQHACANCPMDQYGTLCPQTTADIGRPARTRQTKTR
jgi:MarR family transcriptional repressor of emrRAB